MNTYINIHCLFRDANGTLALNKKKKFTPAQAALRPVLLRSKLPAAKFKTFS